MLTMEEFGRKLAFLRHRQSMTQKQLADHFCVSVQAVSKWERGQSCPDILILDELAKILGAEIKDFFEATDENNFKGEKSNE